MTWVSSFSTYVAIVTEAHPARVKDMLAYMRIIVREASKFGGNGWLTYDAIFLGITLMPPYIRSTSPTNRGE